MLIFAHRGASGHAPENTLKAIDIALDMACDGIEIDVHEVDGELWVIHDRWLDSTTNGQGHIHQYDGSHLRTLDAGHGEVIPTLREVLARVHGQCTLNIEVKSWATERLVLAEMDHAVAELGFSNEQLILSSFNHHILAEAKSIRPQTLIGALTSSIPLTYAQFADDLNAYSIHIDVNFINASYIQDAHKRGLKVYVYTVNELADIKKMKEINVDGIFTNYPRRALAVQDVQQG